MSKYLLNKFYSFTKKTMAGPELKIDQQYTAEEKQQFNEKMATNETKKELFAQKDWIKAEWKTNLYNELSGNLKANVIDLGKAILEKTEGTAYKLLEAYCKRSSRTINQIKTALDKGTADKFILTAILQAGAIACCDKTSVLKNLQKYLPSVTDAKVSFAVDADPRGNTMAALMAIYDDKAGTLTADDFNGGVPSANFITSMTNDIKTMGNIPQEPSEEVKEDLTKSKTQEKKENNTEKGLLDFNVIWNRANDLISHGKKSFKEAYGNQKADGFGSTKLPNYNEADIKILDKTIKNILDAQEGLDKHQPDAIQIDIVNSTREDILKQFKNMFATGEWRIDIVDKATKKTNHFFFKKDGSVMIEPAHIGSKWNFQGDDIIIDSGIAGKRSLKEYKENYPRELEYDIKTLDIAKFIKELQIIGRNTTLKITADFDGKPGIDETYTFKPNKKGYIASQKTDATREIKGNDVVLTYFKYGKNNTRSLNAAKKLLTGTPNTTKTQPKATNTETNTTPLNPTYTGTNTNKTMYGENKPTNTTTNKPNATPKKTSGAFNAGAKEEEL